MTIRQRSLAGTRWLFVLGVIAACHSSTSHDQPGDPDAAVPLDDGGARGDAATTAGYSVSGNTILDGSGHVFIPNGVQLGAINFASSSWKINDSTRFTADVVRMAHDVWHSNTTRIQVSSRNLFAKTPSDAAYLALIDDLVRFANQADMNIILSLQYEGTSNAPLMPTQDSVKFWDLMSTHFAGNPRVFFDVFNEPSPGAITGNGDTADSWMFWKNGRTVGGVAYVGMQQLVDTIRGNGANNLIFTEGICIAACLDMVTSYPLTGANIVYAVHPYFGNNRTTTAMWDKYFGNASRTLPVVADEWGVYDSTGSECVPMASTVVDQFLPYLKAHHVGVIGFALWPGTMIRGWSFTTPTAFDANWGCTATAFPNLSPTAEGAGAALQSYLAQP